jgi:hypothetical protein
LRRRRLVIGLLAGLGVPLLAAAWGVVAYFVFSLNWSDPCSLSQNQCDETTGTQIRAVGALVVAVPGIAAALAASLFGLGFAIARRPWLRRFYSLVLWSLLAGGLFILWAFVPLPALEPHNCGSVDCADF